MTTLSKLRGAIRSSRGNPTYPIELAPGVVSWIPLQKTPLLEALGGAFDNEMGAETGMELDKDTMRLTRSGAEPQPNDWDDEDETGPATELDLLDDL